MMMVSNDKYRLRVFYSSTWLDLKEERIKLFEVIHRLPFENLIMEHFGADPRQPIAVSLEQVGASDIFVCIVGHRYGSIVEYTGKSYTHMEYDEAQQKNIPCLIYIKSDDVPVMPRLIEQIPESIRKLKEFKDTLQKRHTIFYFGNSADLVGSIVADLINLAQRLVYSKV